MRMKVYRRLGLWLCFFFMVFVTFAQYSVTGGKGTPMNVNDSMNDITVWLVNGMDGVQISYTSNTVSNHQWYRYRTNALERVPVNSTQSGNTSTVTNVEEGWGYFVEETTIMQKYIWLIDYSKYKFELSDLSVSGGIDACQFARLESTTEIPDMIYRTPATGRSQKLEREYTVVYETLEWSKDDKRFIRKTEEKPLKGDPFVSLNAPYTDTDFVLKGDQFARHFGEEKSYRTEMYMAKALLVEADTMLITDPFSQTSSGEALSAPATIRFTAYANEPVAAFYIWTIFRSNEEGGESNPIIRYTGSEVEYTFNEFGNFTAKLEVSDRSTTCTDVTKTFSIRIAESYLEIPNAFSPGASPGINDEFRVAYKSLVKFKGWIFNRWGVQLFHWTDPSRGWDGKKGGKYLPPGVYFYVIEAEGSDGEKYKRSGDINLLRSKTIDDAPIN